MPAHHDGGRSLTVDQVRTEHHSRPAGHGGCGWAMPVSTSQDDGKDGDLAMCAYTALRE